MTQPGFRVTYKIVTPESAEYGDAEESGWITEQAVDLRTALEFAASESPTRAGLVIL